MQDASIAEVRRGQWLAFGLASMYLTGTIFLAVEGREVTASAMGIGGVAALAAVFIKVRRKQ
ncbi:hypothetical protein [Kushneria aurantia]|uniref:LPXTG cell wall anchor domain-containing protein n=1 Tax=Kushneria aurantia TaxID=504092 RepID=A0ABV6FZD8_9GAMM